MVSFLPLKAKQLAEKSGQIHDGSPRNELQKKTVTA